MGCSAPAERVHGDGYHEQQRGKSAVVVLMLSKSVELSPGLSVCLVGWGEGERGVWGVEVWRAEPKLD